MAFPARGALPGEQLRTPLLVHPLCPREGWEGLAPGAGTVLVGPSGYGGEMTHQPERGCSAKGKALRLCAGSLSLVLRAWVQLLISKSPSPL